MKIPSLIIIATILSSIAFSACAGYAPMSIEGTAMLPNYKNGDRVMVDKNYREVKRGDVIIFRYPKDPSKMYFKRVVGLPGETLSIKAGEVFINDAKLDEPYLDQIYNHSTRDLAPAAIADKNYFVMGDNRDASNDSRVWGTVSGELIVGKIVTTY